MIHYRRTLQIAPGRQADAVARAHEWVSIWKEAAGVDVRVSVVTTGTLGRLCMSADFESMGTHEVIAAKANARPDSIALWAKVYQEYRDGTSPFVSNTAHNEYWRDA